ncbi:hypothetical protein [Amnibacterium endophyticum]|uniref:P68 RBP/TagC-like beta-propeller domain-containing protein n=1 Tax=Amnibacterium endophyticum TaxID=2109337 RepID=A0ABW4LCB9_9MICO
MADLSRRTLLLGGGALLSAAGAGTAALLTKPWSALADRSAAPPITRPPIPVVTPAPARTAAPTPTAPALGTTLLTQLGLPAGLVTIPRLAIGGVMQDVVAVPAQGVYFVTQKMSGSNGSELPYESTVINRVRNDGSLVDAMVLVDGGHGLGFEAEPDGTGTWIWMTWHGANADSGGRENDFVRLRYTPGTFTRGQANAQLGLTLVPFQDHPEAVHHFDWARDLAVERHFNWPQPGQAATETFVRRRISDLRNGVDDRLDEILLRASPPTTQGFATVNDTFFRWLGAGTSGGVANPADPIVLEQYSWATGQLVATGSYAGLWQPWDDGVAEPQGASVQREADGSASLILGLTTGAVGRRRYRLSKHAGIGAA